MPIYAYTGSDRGGTAVKGVMEGDSIKTAKQKIKKNGILLLSINEKDAPQGKSALFPSLSGGPAVNTATLAVTTRQFASLTKANIPLVEALAALIDQTEHARMKGVLADVRQQVNEGTSLSKAIGKHPKVFAPIFINMIESGEASGTLPLVLTRLADFMESQVRLRQKIISAVTYPAIMMMVGAFLMLGIFTFVIPKIANVFASTGKKLPWYSQLIMDMSAFFLSYWWLIFMAIAVILSVVRAYYSTATGKVARDRLLLRMPIVGEMIRMIAVSRFASTMATLQNGGVPLVSALGIAKSVMGNEVMANAVAVAKENITEGQNLADPLRRSGEFPGLLIHMITIGERTGELPAMLEMVAKNYEEQVDTKISRLTGLLEPMMIIVMGLSVAVIIMAVLVPLLDLQNIH